MCDRIVYLVDQLEVCLQQFVGWKAYYLLVKVIISFKEKFIHRLVFVVMVTSEPIKSFETLFER